VTPDNKNKDSKELAMKRKLLSSVRDMRVKLLIYRRDTQRRSM